MVRRYDSSKMYNNSEMHDNSKMHDNSVMNGDSKMYDNSEMYNNSEMYDNSEMHGNSKMYNNSKMRGNAVLNNLEFVGLSNVVVVDDLSKNIKESIRCQTGLGVFDGKVIAYKQVRNDMTSFYDKKFKYEVGKVAVAKYCNYNQFVSCGEGLHFSNMNFWNQQEDPLNSIFLMAEIKLEDIIAVQEGKIRCKKALILGAYEIELKGGQK